MGSNLNKKNIDFDIIENGSITSVPGFYASACHCGLKSSGKPDICIIHSPGGSTCSGIFTTNKFRAAPVIITKKQLEKTKNIKAIIINSGIANACNGKKGYENTLKTIDIAANQLDIDKKNILISSTGVIGKQLPMEKIEKGISKCAGILSVDGGHNAAKAILTTDLVTKEIAVKIKTVSGEDIIIGGMAKGSGMIEPNMATLLVFITTNVKISGKLLDSLLLEEAAKSFNHITVDGCQSTNDMAIVMANSKSNAVLDNKTSKYYKEFKKAFSYVMKDLSRKIILDGEGATKLIEIKIVNVKKKADAKILAFKVANSNLFKTAMFGQDLNWGRINSALGSAECDFDPDKVNIYIEDVLVVKNGVGVDFDRKHTDKIMKEKEIKFTVDLNSGKEEFNVLTADLSIDYVKINALYRT
ncbi:MAG: bifunctional glutamate N-acetyltransferase/amino-acid acetyltransferase ArgJ [Actinomycetota bacterium]